MMHLIDSHCHLDFEQFDTDRESVLSHCHQLGVEKIIVPGITADNWSKVIDVCQQSDMLYPALGLHPMFTAQHQPKHLTQLIDLIKYNDVISVGEIGLDFYLPGHDKTVQIALFEQQLMIAQQTNLPILIHVRKAHDQTINLLKQHSVSGGIVHAFSGSLQQAEHYLNLGFLFGIGGAITYPRATRLRQLVSELPLSSLTLETDSPDMPLAGMQGQRNTPENIPTILDSLAKIRPESKQDIAFATSNNCNRVLNLTLAES